MPSSKKTRSVFFGIRHPSLPNDVVKNNSILYYRFHCVPQLYISEYNKEIVEEITGEIKAAGKNRETYIYFNNTFGMGAIANARQIQALQ